MAFSIANVFVCNESLHKLLISLCVSCFYGFTYAAGISGLKESKFYWPRYCRKFTKSHRSLKKAELKRKCPALYYQRSRHVQHLREKNGMISLGLTEISRVGVSVRIKIIYIKVTKKLLTPPFPNENENERLIHQPEIQLF